MSQRSSISTPSSQNSPPWHQRLADRRQVIGPQLYRAWISIRRFWWWLSSKWLVSHLVIFIKALPLMTLWLTAGILLWWLLNQANLVRGQEAASLLVALVTAAVGFGIQQWSKLAEEEKRRERREEVLKEIGILPLLIKDNLSEGARRYMAYTRKVDPAWWDTQVQDYLQRLWEENAPEDLRHIVKLWMAFEDNPSRWKEALERIRVQEVIQSLKLAYSVLDEDWQGRAANMLYDLGVSRSEYREAVSGMLQEIEQRSWRAILQPWPRVRPWGPFRSPDPSDVATGVRLLGLKETPFSSGSAESDTLLFKCRVNLSILKELQEPKPFLLFGKSGSGKTASSLFLALDSIRGRMAFPVYRPDIPSESARARFAQLEGLAKAVTSTLLHFLAMHPESFTRQGVSGRAAIAHLLGLYIGTGGNLVLRLQQAGLSPIGTGGEMLKELDRLMQNTSFDTRPAENEMIALLGAARPRGFLCTFVLLDSDDPEDDATATAMAARLQPLLDWTIPLARVGVYLKAFLPETLKPHLRIEPLQPILLEWHTQDLQLLLAKRVNQVGIDSVGVWCDLEARMLSPDERLVRAAQGMPGRLIQLGNQLLARVATHPEKPVITAKDLDDVLGPLPE